MPVRVGVLFRAVFIGKPNRTNTEDTQTLDEVIQVAEGPELVITIMMAMLMMIMLMLNITMMAMVMTTTMTMTVIMMMTTVMIMTT